MNILDDGLQC